MQGVSIDDLLLTYISRVRVRLELNVPLWHFAISKKLNDKIENVQKACVIIILGRLATSDYYCNLAMLNLDPLSNRREKIIKKIARKTYKHPTHRNMFDIIEGWPTRSNLKVRVPETKTARYAKSAVPNLAKIINSM